MYTAIFKEFKKTEWNEDQIVPEFGFEIIKDGVKSLFSRARIISFTFEEFTYRYNSRGRANDSIAAIGKIQKDSIYHGERLIDKISLIIFPDEIPYATSEFNLVASESRPLLIVRVPSNDFDFMKENIGIRPFYMDVYLKNLYSIYKEEKGAITISQLLQEGNAPKRLEWLPFDDSSFEENLLEGLGRYVFDPISIDDLDDKGIARLERKCREYPNDGVGETTYSIIFGSNNRDVRCA